MTVPCFDPRESEVFKRTREFNWIVNVISIAVALSAFVIETLRQVFGADRIRTGDELVSVVDWRLILRGGLP